MKVSVSCFVLSVLRCSCILPDFTLTDFILTDFTLTDFRTNEEEKSGSKTYANRDRDLIIYAVLVITVFGLGIVRAFLFFFVILRSSRALHGQMFRATLRAPLRFFDTNSIGNFIHFLLLKHLLNDKSK